VIIKISFEISREKREYLKKQLDKKRKTYLIRRYAL